MNTLYQEKPLTKAQIAFNKQWIEALRSGEYKQTKNVLFDGKGYCCLGVACKIAGRKEVIKTDMWDDTLYSFTNEIETLPKSIQKKLGFNTDVGYYGDDNNSLAGDNDNGKKFKTIANIIENCLNEKIIADKK